MTINPAYIRAIVEIAQLEGLYNSNPDNLPDILKQFIKIGKDKGIKIEIVYGVNAKEENDQHNTYAGFYITRLDTNKRIFIEDYIVEQSLPNTEKYAAGIEWFNKSIENKN